MNSASSYGCFSAIGNCLTVPFRFFGCFTKQNTDTISTIISSTATSALSTSPISAPSLNNLQSPTDQTLDTLQDINGATLRAIINHLCITELNLNKEEGRRSSFFQQREFTFICHTPNIAILVKKLISDEYKGIGSNIEFLGNGKYTLTLTPIVSVLEAHVKDDQQRKKYRNLQEIFNRVYLPANV